MQQIDEHRDEIKARGPGKRWFAVCEDIFDHEVVGTQVRSPRPANPSRDAWHPFMAWLWLIKEAAWKDRRRIIKRAEISLERGQLVMSQRFMAEAWNWHRKAVREFLDRLVHFKMVRIELRQTAVSPATDQKSFVAHPFAKRGPHRGPTISVITVCNYKRYQIEQTTRGPHAGPQRARKGPARGPNEYIDTRDTRKKVSSSSTSLKEEERTAPLQLAPSIVDELRGVVGQSRADELVAEYLASPYAKRARFLNRAFKGWLRKGGIQITGQGDAAFKLADALALCPKDEHGRPVTKLPTLANGKVVA